MKQIRFLILSLAIMPAFVQAQDDDLYRICTEIVLHPVEDNVQNLPPGMVARAVAFKPEAGKYWPNGKSLRVGFMGGSETARTLVRKYAPEWSQVANIQFVFVEKGPTDLRVGFYSGIGTWSLVGTDASDIAQNRPTINFSWFTGKIGEAECRATILHEFGHALGLLHEHQHPLGGIPWDKSKLYPFYLRTQGWDQAMVDQQVLSHYSSGQTQYSRYDPYSIMHYPIPNSLTIGDFEVGINMNLSPTDRAFVAKVYPKALTSETRPPVTTTTPRPSKPTQPSRPVAQPLSLTIRDEIPASQKREQVWITVDGVTRTFVLDQSRYQSGKVTFTLPKSGQYSYQIRTKTTFLKRENGRWQESVRYGHGAGEINMRRNAIFDLTLGKDYNDRWFEVNLQATDTYAKAP